MPESAAKTSSVKMPWRAPSDTAVNVETLKALQELAGDKSSSRSWKGVVIAILVILAILGLITLAAVLVMDDGDEETFGLPFTLNDAFSDEFKPSSVVGSWLFDRDVFVYQDKDGTVIEVNAQQPNSTRQIVDNSTFKQLNADGYYVSNTGDYVLLTHETEPLYRHSFKASYSIVSTKDQTLKSQQFPYASDVWKSKKKLQYAGWSLSGNSLSFVYENDLYYQRDPDTAPQRITFTGDKFIINGIADWMYEEELFSTNVAHWWSPNDRFIVYAVFNETKVPIHRFPFFGPTSNIYESTVEIPYPKAGDESEDINPKVQLFLVNLQLINSRHRLLNPPDEFLNKEYYLVDVVWQNNINFLVTWLNRPQNKSVTMMCSVTGQACVVNHIEEVRGGWVQIHHPIFVKDRASYVTVLPERERRKTGVWKHVALLTDGEMKQHQGVKFLTHGSWEVFEIVGVNSNKNLVYFIGTGGDPKSRQLYSVGLPDEQRKVHSHMTCLSCAVPDCKYVSAQFSASGQFYFLQCLGPGVPTYSLRSASGDWEMMLDDNAALKARLKTKAMPVKEFIENVTIDGLSSKLLIELYLPPQLVKEHVTQYPLLVYTYAGPGTQQVTYQFNIGWHTYLASSENVIYASIDGRGSSGRGDLLLHEVYKQLGTVEVEDQIAGIRYLKEKFHFVDKNHTSIWGWSYGGFVTSHVIGEPAAAVPCGIAIAPVTDWRYYDTAYTERFMSYSRAKDNFRGYDNAAVLRKAANFKGKRFLLIHGTADDNVHFQHSATLMNALIEEGVDFRSQIYPDKNHAISGDAVSRHLYQTMTDFLQNQCWEGGKPREPFQAQVVHRKGKVISQ